MTGYRKTKVDILLEVLSVIAFAATLLFEIIYAVNNVTAAADVALGCIIVAGIYALLVAMNHYPREWNVLIPVVEQSERYVYHFVLVVKLLFTGVSCYTAVCDLYNQYSSTVIFQLGFVICLIVLAYCKYKMYKILKNKKDDQ